MELKEANDILNAMTTRLSEYLIGYVGVTALQIAISHLEILQKVKEMGGVKKLNQDFSFLGGGEKDIAFAQGEEAGFNQALDLKDAELVGKLEGLEDVFAKIKGCKPNQEDCSFRKCHDFSECKIQQRTIQELILGKKEG